jgi:hypothetical protein
MALFLVLALQSAVSALPAIDFDLARLRGAANANPSRGSGEGEGSDVIVTGRRPPPNPYRLPELTSQWRERPVRAEMSLGGGAVARAYVDSVEFPGGQISRRIMFGIRLPF